MTVCIEPATVAVITSPIWRGDARHGRPAGGADNVVIITSPI